MLSKKAYNTYIKDNFIKKNELLFEKCDENNLTLQPIPEGLFDKLLILLDEVYRKYGFDMQKTCAPNYNKFLIWQKENGGLVNYKDILIATEFIQFCCLADKILDSRRFNNEEKEQVRSKLNVNLFLSEQEYKSQYFEEMDILLNDIRRILTNEESTKSPYYSIIIEKMDKAFKSEIYMSTNFLLPNQSIKDDEMNLLIDKSIEFEIAAFLLCSLSSPGKNTLKVSKCIAEIFWLIDDLCDFTEDINCGRKNSALFYCSSKNIEMKLADRVEMAYGNINQFIDLLIKKIIELRDMVGTDLYEYILNEVWEWCGSVRKLEDK